MSYKTVTSTGQTFNIFGNMFQLLHLPVFQFSNTVKIIILSLLFRCKLHTIYLMQCDHAFGALHTCPIINYAIIAADF